MKKILNTMDFPCNLEKWHKSDVFLNESTVATEMQNVSFVVSFNQNFNSIKKIGFGFKKALNESTAVTSY